METRGKYKILVEIITHRPSDPPHDNRHEGTGVAMQLIEFDTKEEADTAASKIMPLSGPIANKTYTKLY